MVVYTHMRKLMLIFQMDNSFYKQVSFNITDILVCAIIMMYKIQPKLSENIDEL